MLRLFNPDNPAASYKQLKNDFLKHVASAYDRTLWSYNNKYDQERHASTGYLPIIEAKKNTLMLVYKEIKQYVATIEKNYSDPIERSQTLCKYAQSITTADYVNNILFMNILAGKLSKHWLPEYTRYMEESEKTPSNKHP